MAKRKTQTAELDSLYLIKVIFYLVLGSLWVRVVSSGGFQIPVPIGALVGVVLASHERFRIDRKIEYAVLLGAMFAGYWLPIGFVINLY